MRRKSDEPSHDQRLRLATNRQDTQPAEVEARYVCPVCCNPMVLHVDIADDGEPLIRSEHE
jgi:hypothetical protein